MRCLLVVLISLIFLPEIAASDCVYATGCLPSTPEDWERAGVPLRSPSEELRLRSATHLSCCIAGVYTKSTASLALDLPKDKSLKVNMSDVQDQGNLGTCSCFSCAAAIEAQLPKGIKISEAELYIRGKTEGGHNRLREGLSLCKLICVLSNGVLSDQYFPGYPTYEQYVLNILQNIKAATVSGDYDESIDHFRQYCRENIPSYNESLKTITPPRYQAPSGLFGLFVAFTPIPRVMRETFKMFDTARMFRIKTRAYRIFEKEKTSTAQLITDLKSTLLKEIPVVVSVETFAKYEYVGIGKGSYVKEGEEYIRVKEREGDYTKRQWLTTSQYISENNNLVTQNYQDYGYEHEGYHAICICGYDDAYKPDKSKPSVKAFQFKNSWGSTWGSENNGYAWLSEAYLEKSAQEAIVIEVQKRI